MTKGLGGNLNINSQQFYTGATTLNGGVTTLMPGGQLNTIYQSNVLTVNIGATLDLNAGTQLVGSFTSNGGVIPGAGGTVRSTGGTGNSLRVW